MKIKRFFGVFEIINHQSELHLGDLSLMIEKNNGFAIPFVVVAIFQCISNIPPIFHNSIIALMFRMFWSDE